jgi:hypothetical protein
MPLKQDIVLHLTMSENLVLQEDQDLQSHPHHKPMDEKELEILKY